MTDDTAAAWIRGADHYKVLSAERRSEGAGVELACLVLADFCVFEWSGDHGGPSLEMVQLAERVVGDSLDSVIANFMTKAASGDASTGAAGGQVQDPQRGGIL